MSWPQRLSEQVVLLALSLLVGLLAGLSSAAFLLTLEWATATRLSHPALLFGLPVAGLAIGLVYHYGGGRAAEVMALPTGCSEAASSAPIRRRT